MHNLYTTNVKQQDNALQPMERSSNKYANNSTVMPNWVSNPVNPLEATPCQAC
jgi:hypothetical protein